MDVLIPADPVPLVLMVGRQAWSVAPVLLAREGMRSLRLLVTAGVDRLWRDCWEHRSHGEVDRGGIFDAGAAGKISF